MSRNTGAHRTYLQLSGRTNQQERIQALNDDVTAAPVSANKSRDLGMLREEDEDLETVDLEEGVKVTESIKVTGLNGKDEEVRIWQLVWLGHLKWSL